jgi:hypothetical protein
MILQTAEDDNDQSEPKQAAPDSRIAPRIDNAAPLESKEKADDGTDQEESAQEVDLTNLLLCGELTLLPFRVFEEDHDDGDGNAPKRQVDPELYARRGQLICRDTNTAYCKGDGITHTPAPRQAVSKGTTKDGPNHRGDAEHAGQQGNVNGAFPKRNGVADDGHGAGEESGGANTSDGTTDDQHGWFTAAAQMMEPTSKMTSAKM